MLQRLLDKELQVSHMAPCILYMTRVTVRILTRDYEMCLQVEALCNMVVRRHDRTHSLKRSIALHPINDLPISDAP